MRSILIVVLCFFAKICALYPQQVPKIIAFYTAENDLAHISFVNEALPWFDNQAEKIGNSDNL